MGQTDLPYEVWQNVYMDHVSIGNSQVGQKGVLAFIDSFSKYVILEPVSRYDATETVQIFMSRVATIYGLPDRLHSDNGPAFRSRFQDAVFAATGVTREFCTPYRPQANGQVERLFRTIRSTIAIISANHPTRWPEVIPHVAFAYNTSYLRAIDNTPFYLMFGRDPVFKLGQINGRAAQNTDQEMMIDVYNRLQQARAEVRTKLIEHRQKMKAYYDAAVAKFFQNRAFGLEQLVWVKAPLHFLNAQPVRGLPKRYIGPCRIKKINGQILTVVPIHNPSREPMLVHTDHCKQCLYDDGFDAAQDFNEFEIPPGGLMQGSQ
jgi:hypothetical protein